MSHVTNPSDSSHWSHNLLHAMNDPKAKVGEDHLVVVLKDKYPKARHHILILPKKNIESINHVNIDDLNLLYHMESIGKKFTSFYNEYEFKIGYHAIPSMKRLHLHVISTDFNSPYLKTKHHWNTLTTPFFIPCAEIYKQLIEFGKIQIDVNKNRKYLLKRLQCHKCAYLPNTMPELKEHILSHIPT